MSGCSSLTLAYNEKGLTNDGIQVVMSEILSSMAKARVLYPASRFSAVFDLDDTLTNEDLPLSGNIRLLRHLQEANIECVVVTARTSDHYRRTYEQLQSLGLVNISLMCMPLSRCGTWASNPQLMDTVDMYKHAARIVVNQTVGWLLLTVGDQGWDHWNHSVLTSTETCQLFQRSHRECASNALWLPSPCLKTSQATPCTSKVDVHPVGRGMNYN